MKVVQQEVRVATRGRGLYDVTDDLRKIVSFSGVGTGLCTVFVQHTSASLVIQENADPAVLRDMEKWIAGVAPEDARAYEHDAEGPDDMPAHLRAVLTHTSEVVPITRGALALGTWQAVYLWEHRRKAHARTLIVHIAGLA